MEKIKVTNPIIPLDYPDPDIIRVKDVYYMVSTTMYFMPGCEILKSYDLVNWEHACFVYDKLDGTNAQRLVGNDNIYGQGMWAASLRYHEGEFYVVFSANDTRKTYLYRTNNIESKWEKSEIDGFYHDPSLFFDDDSKVYLIYGNSNIWLTELEADLSEPKNNGLNRIIVSEENPILGYEGAHFYKINGFYYVFLIHSQKDKWMRTQACFMSDSLTNEFIGKDILCDDRNYFNQGVAQGGIVDTIEGDWYSILFQDHGAVGRLPILIPVIWENNFPVFGNDNKIPECFYVKNKLKNNINKPLFGSDDFKGKVDTYYGLKPFWQFNHQPHLKGFLHNSQEGYIQMTNMTTNLKFTQTKNMLTQRLLFPSCKIEVTVDVANMNEGDIAGLAVLQYFYSFIAITKKAGNFAIVFQPLTNDDTTQQMVELKIPIESTQFRLGMEVSFINQENSAKFFIIDNDKYQYLGEVDKLKFSLKYFTGNRVALFNWGRDSSGGSVKFFDFDYNQ